MPGHDIIAIGGSAGGGEALRALVRHLPSDLPAALLVVVHVSPDRPSLLPTLLNHAGAFLALHPTDGTPLRQGCIYVAPPDQHMLVEGPLVRVVRGPRENQTRPAIDPLFRSVAACYGSRAVGLILSGTRDDGTAGMLAIKQRGGITVVQDPQEATYSEMPASALSKVQVDYCLPIAEIARQLTELSRQPAAADLGRQDDGVDIERRSISADVKQLESDKRPGKSSDYCCPDCGRVLWEIDDHGLLRLRCLVGHAFSVERALAEQSAGVEGALWMALKTLEERASLLVRIINEANRSTPSSMVTRYTEELHSAEEGASVIRKLLVKEEPGGGRGGAGGGL